MRRALLVATGLLLVFASVALAATYKTGTYKAGSAKADGVSLRIKKGSFTLNRVSFIDTCTNSSDSFEERFTFVKGSKAKLTGKIKRNGRFSGRYKSKSGVVKVTGRVKGRKATVKATESGTRTPDGSTQPYACSGSHTFHAKRAKQGNGGKR